MIIPARLPAFTLALAAPLFLGACATASAPGPVQVTRFVAQDAMLGGTTLFVESAKRGGVIPQAPVKAALLRRFFYVLYPASSVSIRHKQIGTSAISVGVVNDTKLA